MKVHHDEGVANHIDPESCAVTREGLGEALTGARIGQPSSRERGNISGADAVQFAEGETEGRDIASAPTTRRGRRPWHVQTLLAREPGDLAIDRSATAVGPHREGEERAARLAAILVGESPTSIGVQSML